MTTKPESKKSHVCSAKELKQKKANPYSTRAWGELSTMELPPVKWFWGDVFAAGQIQVVFGQGGLGKSRLSLNLARNQVLGLPFVGMDTGTQPMRHLLMGSENSIHRLQSDVRRMESGLSDGDIEKLTNHIRLTTLEKADDAFISLGDPENIQRWIETVEEFKPDVLWVDPYGDVRIGDANSDAETRLTITELSRIARRHKADTGIVILAHARTGAKNILQVIGYDEANFGKDSKALFSCARAVFNMAPGDPEDDSLLILNNSKNNNARKLPPFGIRLDSQTMTYERDETFDFEKWKEEVQSVAAGKQKNKRSCPPDDVALRLVTGGHLKTDYHRLLCENSYTSRGADATINRLVDQGRLVLRKTKTWPLKIFIGTEADVERKISGH
jgi:hypothetical protein